MAIRAEASLKALFKNTAREGDALLNAMEERFAERTAKWKRTSPLRRQIEKRYREKLSAAKKAVEAAAKAALAL